MVDSGLNAIQYKAAPVVDGPEIIFAGAGSGTPKTLTARIAHMIDTGISPYNILAITFTKKAANEILNRVNAGGRGVNGMWVCTFHSMCNRILREFSPDGFTKDFSIVTDSEVQKILKDILVASNVFVGTKEVHKIISMCKNEGKTVYDWNLEEGNNEYTRCVLAYSEAYQGYLKSHNMMDFDDLLVFARKAFDDNGVLSYYQNRFRYILIDDYQDINRIQHEIVSLLAHGADGLIKNNCFRVKKKIWTSSETDGKLTMHQFYDDKEEAECIIEKIMEFRSDGRNYDDFAVLYRERYLSERLESELIRFGIPYMIVDESDFFERKEIKDLIAYMELVSNKKNDIALERIVNVPNRGIGEKTILTLKRAAKDNDISIYEAMEQETVLSEIGNKAASAVRGFVELMEVIDDWFSKDTVKHGFEDMVCFIGYNEYILSHTENSDERFKNIERLRELIQNFENENENADLSGMLQDFKVSSSEVTDATDGRVILSTIHASKGLEYPIVFLIGLEEDIFPSKHAANRVELEGERRLCYVGVSRAKEEVFVSSCRKRCLFGVTNYYGRSCFLDEMENAVNAV